MAEDVVVIMPMIFVSDYFDDKPHRDSVHLHCYYSLLSTDHRYYHQNCCHY